MKLHVPAGTKRACLVTVLLLGIPAFADSGPESATVVGQAATGYVRGRDSNGSTATESYAFGKGGRWTGGMVDPTLDNLSFLAIAHALAPSLAGQGYIPARDPHTTRLLIMIYWGATDGTQDTNDSNAYTNLMNSQYRADPDPFQTPYQSTTNRDGVQLGIQGTPNHYDENLLMQVIMQNRIRDRTDQTNAAILGYDDALSRGEGHTLFSAYRSSLLTDVEVDRYFVVLMAYDFQEVWKRKNHRLLWETRFSVDRGSRDFGKMLPSLAAYASRAFGRDTHGLIRAKLAEGHVDFGNLMEVGSSESSK